jgi:hypothetical protein
MQTRISKINNFLASIELNVNKFLHSKQENNFSLTSFNELIQHKKSVKKS